MVNFQHVLASALALSHHGLAAKSQSHRQRAEALLKKMTWEEKVGQMGGVRRLLKLGPVVDEENYEKIHRLQNGNMGEIVFPALAYIE